MEHTTLAPIDVAELRAALSDRLLSGPHVAVGIEDASQTRWPRVGAVSSARYPAIFVQPCASEADRLVTFTGALQVGEARCEAVGAERVADVRRAVREAVVDAFSCTVSGVRVDPVTPRTAGCLALGARRIQSAGPRAVARAVVAARRHRVGRTLPLGVTRSGRQSVAEPHEAGHVAAAARAAVGGVATQSLGAVAAGALSVGHAHVAVRP